MGVFNVVKFLDRKDRYAEIDDVCPECNSKMYLEMSKEDLEQLKEQIDDFDINNLNVNRFCWSCEKEQLKSLKSYVDNMNLSKQEAIERMRLGAFQQNEAQIFMALNQLCQVFMLFMDLFQFHIEYPEDEEDKEDKKEKKEESVIIMP